VTKVVVFGGEELGLLDWMDRASGIWLWRCLMVGFVAVECSG